MWYIPTYSVTHNNSYTVYSTHFFLPSHKYAYDFDEEAKCESLRSMAINSTLLYCRVAEITWIKNDRKQSLSGLSRISLGKVGHGKIMLQFEKKISSPQIHLYQHNLRFYNFVSKSIQRYTVFFPNTAYVYIPNEESSILLSNRPVWISNYH